VDEFAAALDSAIHEDPTQANRRVEMARKYSWTTRMEEIGGIVTEALARKENAR